MGESIELGVSGIRDTVIGYRLLKEGKISIRGKGSYRIVVRPL